MELVSRYQTFWLRFLRWRDGLAVPGKLLLSVGMACLIGLLAQVRLPLPYSPVPVTAQTLGVLISGVVLGRRWGGAGAAIYFVLGSVGLPWFSASAGGIGPTWGYIFGFVLAALFLGYTTGRHERLRSLPWLVFLMLLASLVLIYVPGVLWLGYWLRTATGAWPGLPALLGMGVLPFLAGDITKAVLAAGISRLVLPGGPVDLKTGT